MALTEVATTLSAYGINVGWAKNEGTPSIIFIEDVSDKDVYCRVEFYTRDKAKWREYAKMLRLAAKAADEISKSEIH